jgi:hypothetical protein
MLLPSIHPASCGDTTLNRAEGSDHAAQAAKGTGHGVSANLLYGFERFNLQSVQAAM